eukprot:6490913-Amphidinium_carterae.1
MPCLEHVGADDIEQRGRPVIGIIVLLIDDVIDGGTDQHRQNMDYLQHRFKFGRYKSIMQTPEGCMFNGRRLRQKSDYTIEKVHVPKKKRRGDEDTQKVCKDEDYPLNQGEKELVKTINMKLLWAARQGRPDALGTATYLSQTKPEEYRLVHLREAAKMVAHLKATSNLELVFPPLPLKDVQLLTFADGSPNTKEDLRGQGGLLVGLTTSDMQQGRQAPAIMLAWRSGRLERVTASSLAAESYSLMAAVAMSEFVWQLWCECTNSSWRPHEHRRQLMRWESGQVLSSKGTLVARDDLDHKLRTAVAITDAKSLYDALRREARSKEPRVAMAVSELKQGLSLLGMQIRWVPHELNAVDAFTKNYTKANLAPLLHLMRTASYQVSDELQLMLGRKEDRAAGMKMSREKKKA